MQNAQIFKRRYLLIPLIAILAYGIYFLMQFSPLEQHVIKKIKVNNLANLYITEADAGATTNFSYRYYLFDATKSDAEFLESLNDNEQYFLITEDDKALVSIENNAIYLNVKGAIFTFHSPGSYRNSTGIYSVPIYLNASPY